MGARRYFLMSYVRKRTSNPTIYGGQTESEYMHGGKKRSKKRASKRRTTRKRAGMAIKAKAPGIMTGKKHSFGKKHKF
jgi:hypothetical protein